MKAKPIAELEASWRPLVEAARAVQANAYAPYSKFLVGSCLEDEKGVLHTGCNVENANYSGGICAERTATVKMVSTGARKIKRVLVVTSADEPCFPCGFCLQVLREFGKDAVVTAIDAKATVFRRATLPELFPESFGPEHLK